MSFKRFKNIFLVLFAFYAFSMQGADAIMEPPAGQPPKMGSNIEPVLTDAVLKQYKGSTKDIRLIYAAESLKGTVADYSRRAILGDNLTGKPIQLEFRDLSTLNTQYANFDALGWKQRGRLNIFINIKHQYAPKEALAAVLAHEAIHQDELNSLNEEVYCWTLEAAVWTQLTDDKPELMEISSALVDRENTIKKLFVKGNYTSKYIKKSVLSNAGYQGLPSRSPGFEDEDL